MSHFATMTSHLPAAAAAAAVAGGDAKNPVFCPKPRRLCPLPPLEPVPPLRCNQSIYSDSGAGMDLLDLLLSKGEESNLAAPSPQLPFFCGSPPRRTSNPVVHDSRFGMDCPPLPLPAWPMATPVARPAAAPPMSPRATGCVRAAKFGFEPAAVRIEGFDCLDRDRCSRAHGITAMA